MTRISALALSRFFIGPARWGGVGRGGCRTLVLGLFAELNYPPSRCLYVLYLLALFLAAFTLGHCRRFVGVTTSRIFCWTILYK